MSKEPNNEKNHEQPLEPVLLMAGGTGGHVFPALACAAALRAQGIPVHWLGTPRGLEAQVVPNAGIAISYISVGGVRGKGILTKLLAPFKIFLAIYQAGWVLARVQPRVVLGMGGFASGPGGIAAWLLGVPLVIHEQNAVAGLTNNILARFAKRTLEAFPGAFDKKYQALHTGNPLRYDILALNPPALRPIHKPFRLLVIGGSLGAQALNTVVPQAVQQMQHAVQLWHQIGRHNTVTQRVGHDDRVEPFIEQMAAAYVWADLIVCRAGAMTISEIAQVGVPAILIPYPHAVDDHQTHNAQFLVAAGAAILLPQHQLTADQLAALLDELIEQPARLQAMSKAARNCAKPDAVLDVVNQCLQLAQKNTRT